MKKFGVIGRRLGHSYSPRLHAVFGDYEYGVYEIEPDRLAAFIETNDLDGFNVTIPYKKDIIPYLCGMSDTAKRLESVNTVVRTKNGFYGDNTDYFGFEKLLAGSGFNVRGKKAVVLGNGGVCPTVCAVLRDQEAKNVTVISRRGEDNYTNLERNSDAALIVNTTPVGMFPDNLNAPLSIKSFDAPECVIDLIYNPFRTALAMEADNLGIPASGGISMLAYQAKRAAELFLGSVISDSLAERAVESVVREKRNIILIGMPGCGKSTLGAAVAETLGRDFIDTDDEIVRTAGMNIPQIFERDGENAFRRLESAELRRAGMRSGIVISTGGGVVTVPDNYAPLAQNGVIIFIERALGQLSRDGRPVSMKTSAAELYEKRLPLYKRFADATVFCDGDTEKTRNKIVEAFNEIPYNKRT